MFDAIERFRPTVFFGGPSLWSAMLAVSDAEDAFDLSSVRLYVSGGEALSTVLFDRWRDRFGLGILNGLGSTECLHIFISTEARDLRGGVSGAVVPPYDVKLTDEHGDPVAPGVYTIVGRADDVVKVRGLKVSPLEIEERLSAHDAVAECAVVGATTDDGLTTVCAYVRLNDGFEPSTQLKRALRDHLRGLLAPHKVPRAFEFVDELPRSGTGKLARYRLRERLAAPAGR